MVEVDSEGSARGNRFQNNDHTEKKFNFHHQWITGLTTDDESVKLTEWLRTRIDSQATRNVWST